MALYSPCISNEEASGGRVIRGSLRFNESDSTSMTRTPSGAGNRKTWTHSCWLRKTDISNTGPYFLGGSDTNNYFKLTIGSDNKFYAMYNDGGSYNENFRSTQLFRDLSGWIHVVSVWDTTESSASDRVKIYVNGTEIAGTRTNDPALNYDGFVNNTVHHDIGRATYNAGEWFNGYMSEINFVDGQALGPTYFGFSDPLTGIWRPKKFDINTTTAKVWGTCGFYLPFDGSGATVGTDQTGLTQNNWTLSNLSGSNVFYESPSGISFSADPNAGLTTTGFPTKYSLLDFNSYDMSGCSNLGEGGLRAQIGNSGEANKKPIGNMSFTSGKYYWEWEYISTTDSGPWCGVANPVGHASGGMDNRWTIRVTDNEKTQRIDGSNVSQSALTGGNGTGWYGMAVDMDDGKMWLSFEGAWQASGDPETGANAVWDTLKSAGTGEVLPYWGTDGGSTNVEMRANFGQSTFRHSCPKGFLPLCAANRTAPMVLRNDIEYFKPVLYTGDTSAALSVPVGFRPDLMWIKCRETTDNQDVNDTVRGIGKRMWPNGDNAQSSPGGQWTVDSLERDGFKVGAGPSEVNRDGDGHVAWCWKAGGGTGAGGEFWKDGVKYAAAADIGLSGADIATTGASINTRAGFSIITYVGTKVDGDTVAHGLGKMPAFVIVKKYDETGNWGVYHQGLSSNVKVLTLNSTNHEATPTDAFFDWSATTTNLLVLGFNSITNDTSEPTVAYLWADVPGVQKFGRYTGSGAVSNFVDCGFRPALIICKRAAANSSPDTSTSYTSWSMYDTSRNTYAEQTPNQLFANCNVAEGHRGNCSATSNLDDMMIETHATGFYLHDEGSEVNASTGHYVYCAWAEAPSPSLYGGIANAR